MKLSDFNGRAPGGDALRVFISGGGPLCHVGSHSLAESQRAGHGSLLAPRTQRHASGHEARSVFSVGVGNVQMEP